MPKAACARAINPTNPVNRSVLLILIHMMHCRAFALLSFLLVLHGCPGDKPINLRYKAIGSTPETLAVYEGWFGERRHLDVGYSSHDPSVLNRQIREAKQIGLTGFVVDWYADRDPFINQTYGLMQKLAEKNDFRVAMMYDEANSEVGATDQVIADLNSFHETYLSPNSPGVSAYLTYDGRPLIFIFPRGHSTDWNKVRADVNKWNPAPLLINENLPGRYVNDFDGYYVWVRAKARGASDGLWGQQHLTTFYRTMATRYPDKMIVGGTWPGFDDSKASWGLNRYINGRCGQTFRDTFNYWKGFFPKDQVIPFLLIETWNDYEEGTAIENGVPTCGASPGDQAPTNSGEPNR